MRYSDERCEVLRWRSGRSPSVAELLVVCVVLVAAAPFVPLLPLPPLPPPRTPLRLLPFPLAPAAGPCSVCSLSACTLAPPTSSPAPVNRCRLFEPVPVLPGSMPSVSPASPCSRLMALWWLRRPVSWWRGGKGQWRAWWRCWYAAHLDWVMGLHSSRSRRALSTIGHGRRIAGHGWCSVGRAGTTICRLGYSAGYNGGHQFRSQ